jgi:hypothetical protein
MARVLHLLKADDPLAAAVMAQQRAAGDDVTLALLPDAPGLTPPAGVAVHRVPDDWTWDTLLEQIFEADQVIAW